MNEETLMSAQSALRFEFGENWTRFLSVVNQEHISMAEARLKEALGDIRGKSFLDIGCGSGIHSLAAVRLGARLVHSFDFDTKSVACSSEMKRRFAPNASWTICQGSALDADYLRSLGQFDVVYSWGVLHHTGDMWNALNLIPIVARNALMIAIYNDEGWQSKGWHAMKKTYNRSGWIGRRLIELFVFITHWGGSAAYHSLHGRPLQALNNWRSYRMRRGMSPWHDVVDWAGGFPFEVARPDQVTAFFADRGFELAWSKLTVRSGCNEFVFLRRQA